jgi:hypothetical protein
VLNLYNLTENPNVIGLSIYLQDINWKLDNLVNLSLNRTPANILKHRDIPKQIMHDAMNNLAYFAEYVSEFKTVLRKAKALSNTPSEIPLERLDTKAKLIIQEEEAKFKDLYKSELSEYVCVVANSKIARHNLEKLASKLHEQAALPSESALNFESNIDGKVYNAFKKADTLVYAILEAAKYSKITTKIAENAQELERRKWSVVNTCLY